MLFRILTNPSLTNNNSNILPQSLQGYSNILLLLLRGSEGSEYPEGTTDWSCFSGFRIGPNAQFPSFVTVTYSRAGTKISTIAFIFHLDWHFVSQSKASLVGFTSISSFVEVAHSPAGTILPTIVFIFTILAF